MSSHEVTIQVNNPIKKKLTSSRDWTEWFGLMKNHAITLGIWEYLDLDKEEVSKVEKPKRPVLPPANADTAIQTRFNLELKIFEMDYNDWRIASTNMNTFRRDLINSVDPAKITEYITELVDTRDVLKALEKDLAPTNQD